MRKIQIEYMLFKNTIKKFNYLLKGYSQSNFDNLLAFIIFQRKIFICKPIGNFMRYSWGDLKGI